MKVRAKVKCFVGNTLRTEGEIFEYEGPENACLEEIGGAPKPAAVKPAKPGKPAAAPKASSKASDFLEGK